VEADLVLMLFLNHHHLRPFSLFQSFSDITATFSPPLTALEKMLGCDLVNNAELLLSLPCTSAALPIRLGVAFGTAHLWR
jgi:hypothetical protein